jgi:hypothetical protein
MYKRQDGGHVETKVWEVYYTKISEVTKGSFKADRNIRGRCGIDAWAYPIVKAFNRVGLGTTHSCGGHSVGEPVEVGICFPASCSNRLSERGGREVIGKTNIELLIEAIEGGMKLQKASCDEFKEEDYPSIALERIEYEKGHTELEYFIKFYPITTSLADDYGDRKESHEIIYYWNKTIMVMQLAETIDNL